LYEWSHGQVFLIAKQPAGETGAPGENSIEFIGASEDGRDLYFFDPAALNWENPQNDYAAWDAREGGGFAQPPPAPPGCEPDAESSCQGASSQPASAPAAGSVTLAGAGNLVAPASKSPAVTKVRPPTRAQKLAKALKACHRYRSKAKRASCEKRARKLYGSKSKSKSKSRKPSTSRGGGK
jgi:hypothetical protein